MTNLNPHYSTTQQCHNGNCLMEMSRNNNKMYLHIKVVQGRCSFKDKHSPVQVTFIENVVKIHISQVIECRGDMFWIFRCNPNLHQKGKENCNIPVFSLNSKFSLSDFKTCDSKIPHCFKSQIESFTQILLGLAPCLFPGASPLPFPLAAPTASFPSLPPSRRDMPGEDCRGQ